MPVDSITMHSLLGRQTELKKSIQEQMEELNNLNRAIASLAGNGQRYNWTELAIGCITSNAKFLQTSDILECAIKQEDKGDEKRKRNALVGLSVALNNLCSKGVLRKIVVKGVKGHFYGLIEWFNEDGSVKSSYIVNMMARYGKINDPLKMTNEEIAILAAGAGLA